ASPHGRREMSVPAAPWPLPVAALVVAGLMTDRAAMRLRRILVRSLRLRLLLGGRPFHGAASITMLRPFLPSPFGGVGGAFSSSGTSFPLDLVTQPRPPQPVQSLPLPLQVRHTESGRIARIRAPAPWSATVTSARLGAPAVPASFVASASACLTCLSMPSMAAWMAVTDPMSDADSA